MRLAYLAVLATACVASSATADTYRVPRGATVVDYHVDVELDGGSDRIQVSETLEAAFADAGVRTLTLDLCNLVTAEPPDKANPCQAPRGRKGAPAPTNIGKGMIVSAVRTGGQALRFQHRDDRLVIVLPRPTRAGERATITLDYGGTPAAGLLVTRNAAGQRVFFSDNWPNKGRNWLATIDHISSKTTKTMSVVAPNGYQVISNGRLQSQIDLADGRRRTTWVEAVRVPVWQFALGVAPMRVHHLGTSRGVEFSAWLRPENTGFDLETLRASTRSAFDFFSERIGPYPFEKLAQVEAAGSLGAMENASSIFYNNGFDASPHEIAHQWFGNSATESDWDHVWLSEGFATYLDLLHTEHVKGRDAFLAEVGKAQGIALKYALANPASTVVHPNNVSDSDVLRNAPQIYFGGAMVLHTLRGVLGDARFWAALRLYYDRYRDSHATTDDFRRAAEDACKMSGDCSAELADLSWFFDQWLRRGGVPQVTGEWWYDADKRAVMVQLRQTQAQGSYRMPIDLAVGDAVGKAPQKRIALVIDGPVTTATIPVDAEPFALRLDPDLRVPLLQAQLVKR